MTLKEQLMQIQINIDEQADSSPKELSDGVTLDLSPNPFSETVSGSVKVNVPPVAFSGQAIKKIEPKKIVFFVPGSVGNRPYKQT